MEETTATVNGARHQTMTSSNSIDEKLRALQENASVDFDARISLIREIEQSSPDDIGSISLIYDKFLSEFPLCHEYWIKYSSHKTRLCTQNEVVQIFERAIKSLTFSVHIWLHYCKFGVSNFEDPSDIRRLFERALLYVGKDYLCHEIWDKYIEFEYSQKQWNLLANVYINVLKFPTKKLHLYFDSFRKLATLLEEEAPLKGIQNKKNKVKIQIEISDISSIINDFVNSSDYNVKPDLIKKYLLAGEILYEKSKEIEKNIIFYEALITRNYFDVKPLDDSELENWHKYLDFVETQEDFDWSVKLYERCLISCANYSEFWIRYMEFVDSKGGREISNLALARSPSFFRKKIASYRIYCAISKEHMGDSLNARSLFLHDFGRFSSDFIKEINREANLVKRMGNIEAGCKIYEKAIESSIENKNFEILADIYTNFAQFKFAATSNTNEAREVFLNGVEQIPCKSIIKGLIQFEIIHGGADQIPQLDSIISNLILPNSNLSYEDREEISLLLFEFVDLYGNIQEIRKMWARHCRLFPQKLRNVFPLNPNNSNTDNNNNNNTLKKQKLEKSIKENISSNENTSKFEKELILETNYQLPVPMEEQQKDKKESAKENDKLHNTQNPDIIQDPNPVKEDRKQSEMDAGQSSPVSDPNPVLNSKSETELGREFPVSGPNPVNPDNAIQPHMNVQQNNQHQMTSSSQPYQNVQQYQMWQQYYQQQQMYYQHLSLEQQQHQQHQMAYYQQQQQQMYQLYLQQQQQQQWIQQQQQQKQLMAMNYGASASASSQQMVTSQEAETPQTREKSDSNDPAQARTPSKY